MMKPQELVDMLLAAAGGSFQFDCNTALDAVDVVLGVMDDLDALNLILKANKEMLKSETHALIRQNSSVTLEGLLNGCQVFQRRMTP